MSDSEQGAMEASVEAHAGGHAEECLQRKADWQLLDQGDQVIEVAELRNTTECHNTRISKKTGTGLELHVLNIIRVKGIAPHRIAIAPKYT